MRRFRFPADWNTTAFVVLLSAVAATIAVVATVMAVLAYARQDRAITRANDAISQIQHERLAVCHEQNAHHDATIHQLDLLIDRLPAGPQRDRAKQSEPATVLLIEALAPRRDCRALVRAHP